MTAKATFEISIDTNSAQNLRVHPVAVVVPQGTMVDRATLAFIFARDGKAVVGDHSITIDWGDRTRTDKGTVEQDLTCGRVRGTHQYAAAGLYKVVLGISGNITGRQIVNTMVCLGSMQERYLARVYRDLIGFVPDNSEMQSSLMLADQGAAMRDIVAEILRSPAYCRCAVAGLYQQFLNSEPTQQEMTHGIALMKEAGASELRAIILASDRFYQERGDGGRQSFIAALIQAVMGRDPTAIELQDWQNHLNPNTSRESVVRQLLASLAARLSLSQYLLGKLLPQSLDTGILRIAAQTISSLHGQEQGILSIMNTPDYIGGDLTDATLIADLTRPVILFQCNASFDYLKNHIPTAPDVRGLFTDKLQKELDSPQSSQALFFHSVAGNGRELGGIWSKSSISVPAARDAMLMAETNIVPEGAMFAFQVPPESLQVILSTVNGSIESHLSTHITLNGTPQLTFPNATTIMVVVAGTYHYTVPNTSIGIDISFTVTYTDRLTLDDNGILECTSGHTVDADTAGLEALVWGLSLIGLGVGAVPIQGEIDSKLSSVIPPDFSIGQQIAKMVDAVHLFTFPGVLQKLTFAMDTLTMDETNGIVVSGGSYPVIRFREPSVRIGGPLLIAYPPRKGQQTVLTGSETFLATYDADTQEMVTPINAIWDPPGTAIPGTPPGMPASVQLEIPFDDETGAHTWISVQVTDATGLQASATREIQVYIDSNPPPPPRMGPPKPLNPL